MPRFRNYFKRPTDSNYLGVQVIGGNYGKGGADLISSVPGFTTATSSSGTDFIYTWSAPNATSSGIVTLRVGTASTWGHSVSGVWYPKYYSDPRVNEGVQSARGKNYSTIRVLVVGSGGGGGAANYGGYGGSGGNGGSVFDTTFTGLNTSYTIKFGLSPEPSSRVYFQNTNVGVNTFGQAGAGGAGGAGANGSGGNAQSGSGGLVSDISGSSLGYGGGGGGGGAPPGPGSCVPWQIGAPGSNGGGQGGNRTSDCGGQNAGYAGVRGGGGGGAGYSSPPTGGGAGGPFMVIVRSAPGSTGTGVFDQ